MKLVLDTNVVMELLHWHDPRSAALMAEIEAGRLHCFTDADCLNELARVLGYPQFARDAAAQQALYARYRALTAEIPTAIVTTLLPRCRDTDDQKFLELAARCAADLLVTRDKELLKLARGRRRPPPFAIVTPEQALACLAAPSPEPFA